MILTFIWDYRELQSMQFNWDFFKEEFPCEFEGGEMIDEYTADNTKYKHYNEYRYVYKNPWNALIGKETRL